MSDDQVRALREDIRRLFEQVGELTVKVTELTVTAKLANNNEQVSKLDERVRALENLEQRRLGVGAILGFLVGTVGSVVMALFAWWLSKR